VFTRSKCPKGMEVRGNEDGKITMFPSKTKTIVENYEEGS
jgi:hypothetical protein